MRAARVISLFLVFCLIFVVGCSSSRLPASSTSGNTPSAADGKNSTKSGDVVALDSNRMIVRSVDISMVVNDVIQTRDKIISISDKYQGYLVTADFKQQNQDYVGKITIRVSDDKLESAMADIRLLANRITAEHSTSQDVTAQYVDLKARLKNAQATEAQYLTLINKASQINDIIQIQDKLSQVRQTIEQLQGQMQYLESTSSTSLISISLEPESSNQPVVQGGWSFTNNLRSAAHGFIEFGKVFVTILIWVVIFVPLWGTILGIIIWRRRVRKSSARN